MADRDREDPRGDRPIPTQPTTPAGGVANLRQLQQRQLTQFREFEESRQGRLFLPGAYIPPQGFFSSPQEWFNKQVADMANVSMPDFVPIDAERDERGLPAEWVADYQNQVLGPNNEPLPQGATSWDRNGEPYFGDEDFGIFGDLKAWWKKTWWELTRPPEDAAPITAFGQDFEERLITSAELAEGAAGRPGPITSIKPFIEVIVPETLEFIRQIGDRFRNPELEARQDVGFLGALGRVSGEVLKAFGGLLNAATEGLEQAVGGAILIPADRLAERSNWAPLGDDAWGKFFKNANIFIAAPGRIYQIGRAAEAVLTGRWTKKETIGIVTDIDKNLQAARIAYSSLATEGLASDFIDRMNRGEDPRLLAIELEDPVAEMWGQILNDPLLVWGWLTKGKKALATVDMASARYAIDPDVARVLNVSQRGGRARILDNVDELVEVTGKFVRNTRTARIEEGANRGLRALIASAKQSVYGRETEDILGLLAAHHYENGDALFDTLRGMGMYASDNPVVRAEGLAWLSKSGLDEAFLFSEPMARTSIVLNELLFDAAGKLKSSLVDDIAAIAGDPNQVGELLGRKLQNIYKRNFPDIQTQVIQNERYVALLAEDADKAADFLRANPLADQTIGAATRRAADFNSFMQKALFKPMHAAQGVLYMMLSPMYWLRNRYSNAFHVMVDQGVKPGLRALIFGPGNAIAELEKYTGGVLPAAAKLGFGGPVAEVPQFFKKGFLAKAMQNERDAGQILMAHSMRKTMLNALEEGKALPQLFGEIRGITESESAYLVGLIRDNGGDVDNAIKEFFSFKGQSRRHLGFLSAEDQAFLYDHKMYDDVMAAYRESNTTEELADNLQKIKDDYDEFANLTGGEPQALDVNGMTGTEGRYYKRAVDGVREVLGDQVADLMTRRINANRAFREATREALKEIENKARVFHQQEFTRRLAQNPELAAREGLLSAGQLSDAGAQAAGVEFAEIFSKEMAALDTLWDDVFVRADDMRESTWAATRASRRRDPDLADLWSKAGMDGSPPTGMGQQQFRDLIWESYRDRHELIFSGVRDQEFVVSQGFMESMRGRWPQLNIETPMRANAVKQYNSSRMYDNAFIDSKGRAWVLRRFPGAPTASDDEIRAIEKLVGGKRMTLEEVELADAALKRGALPEEAARLEEIRLAEDQADIGVVVTQAEQDARLAEKRAINEAILERVRAGPDELVHRNELEEALRTRKKVNGIYEGAEPVIGPDAPGQTPTAPRVAHETRGALKQWMDEVLTPQLEENINSVPVTAESTVLEADLRGWATEAKANVTTARSVAVDVASAAREFSLHDYGKRFGIDLFLAYLYPYQFWHSRTYARWIKRIANDPFLFSAYSTYRKAMEKAHSGLPDWWKHQINTNELLGIESENPLYFNLEATLNPIHGLTNVDFSDKYKRVDSVSSTLDDLNKFGPGTWTVFSLALATYYHMKGQEEASAKWAGRLTTATRTIRDMTALAGIRGGKGLEVDPLINFFSGGLGPYERPRVGRALGDMLDEGYSEEDLIDAANNQAGPIWDEAVARAIRSRAAGNTFGFIGGVGFKPRTQTDIQIDRMYNDMYGLINIRDNLSSQEYQDKWEELRQAYPFLDIVLLSRKGGLERDEAFAWNVLRRIPPSMNREFSGLVGMQEDAISRFYESKGDLTLLTESERMDFMAGVIDLGAILEIPSGTTRQEWQRARSAYSVMRERGEERFGDDIWDRIDVYFGAKGDTQLEKDRAEAILEADPIIGEALDWQSLYIGNNPFLNPYYNGLNKIEGYFKGQMYKVIEEELGSDIWDKWSTYWSLKDAGADFRQYWDDNPELERYGEMKDDMLAGIEEHFEQFQGIFPEARPATVRPDVEGETAGQRAILEALTQQLRPSPQELMQLMGEPLFGLVSLGGPLPEVAMRRLEELAEELGMTVQEILQLTMGTVLQ